MIAEMSQTRPLPAAPSPDIDWANIGFDLVPAHAHVVHVWRKASGWDAGTVVGASAPGKTPADPAGKTSADPAGKTTGSTPAGASPQRLQIDAWATALHYGQACFEGLKAFRMRDGRIRIFRPQLNARRLAASCAAIGLPPPPLPLFLDAVVRAVSANTALVPPHGTGASLYIRPIVFGSGPQIGLTPAEEATFIVLVNPVGDYYRGGFGAPVKALVQHGIDRAAPRGSGNVKAAGNYAPIFAPSCAAKARGYAVMLFLDAKDGRFVEEFATSNFAALTAPDPTASGRRTYVTPRSRSILPSITNRSLTEIAHRHFGWIVQRRSIEWSEVVSGAFEEIAACGTAVVITPIGSIDREFPSDPTDPNASISLPAITTAATSDIAQPTPIDDFWDDSLPDPALSIETATVASKDFSGFRQLQTVYRQIQSGDLDGWESWGWMYPAEGI